MGDGFGTRTLLAIDFISYLPVTGGAQQIPLSNSDFEETQGQVSPDGCWLSYTSNETGREEVHVRSMPPSLGGPTTPLKLRVSKEGGSAARWREDGKELYFISSGRQLMAVPMNESAEKISPGEPRTLFRVRSVLRNGFTYEPAANGKKFLFNDPLVEQAPVPITVIVNWQGLLDQAK